MDHLSPQQRYNNMAAIKSKDTKPEMIVRRGLWKRGFRYRLNHKRLPGHPDLVLRKYRTCIFVNGCFWHGHRSLTPNPSPKGEGSEYIHTKKQGAGPRGAATAGGDGVALHHGMGVRTEALEAGGDAGRYCLHAEPYLAAGPYHNSKTTNCTNFTNWG